MLCGSPTFSKSTEIHVRRPTTSGAGSGSTVSSLPHPTPSCASYWTCRLTETSKARGLNPYTVDWVPFLTFVVSRVNTTSGIRYGDDRTIAMISFAGEVDGIKGGDNTRLSGQTN